MKRIRKKILPCYFEDVKAKRKILKYAKMRMIFKLVIPQFFVSGTEYTILAENYQEKLSMYCETRSTVYKMDFVLLVGN